MRTVLLLAIAALAAPVTAQGKAAKLPKWKIDPYTKNDPELMAKAGYVSYGPFPLGSIGETPTQTTQIEDALEYVQFLWIETKHFRLGCALPTWAVSMDVATRKKIRAELGELAEKLPNIKPKTRRLDPWLRAHLYAHRLEKLYAEIQTLFGVTDEDFPQDTTQLIRKEGDRYMGHGPYLGMKQKYCVLIFDKMSSHQQYLSTFIGKDTKFPQRWHFKESSTMMFCVATDTLDSSHDTAMHCAVAFNVSQLCLSGFRYYSYDLPVWIREGWAHWHLRRVDPKYNNFDQQEGGVADKRKNWKWAPYVRNLVVTKGKYKSFAEVSKWRNFGKFAFNDHTTTWSRMDWLLSQGPEKWQKFLFAVKGRVDENWMADQSDLVGAVRTALKDAYGLSILNFDDRWADWVKKTYPSK